ncbi:hypothetical protein FRC08_010458 [Ceratobasidium sp. 394]|nr:hypothetical protein FRC08_010458 [Ceratobasidium sp. 394]
MEGPSVPQPATPDGHSRPPPQYDPNVASTSATGAQPQTVSDPDNSMEWQDDSFMSNEVVPPDEDEAAYKRRKARERQRRKRMKDRANGIGRNGQPATPRRFSDIEVAQFAGGASPWADPPPDPAALAAMTPEEARKEKMRRAARERQRKHRAVVRARKAEEENAEDGASASGASQTLATRTLRLCPTTSSNKRRSRTTIQCGLATHSDLDSFSTLMDHTPAHSCRAGSSCRRQVISCK